ncbi:MAG: hypothetical protein V7641_5421 [Blastocatellia bacterium]
MLKNTKTARILALSLLLFTTHVLPTAYSSAYANGLQNIFVVITAGQTIQRNEPNESYGRWKTSQNLRNYIIKTMQREIDEADFHDHLNAIAILGDLSDLLGEMAMIDALKADMKNLLANDRFPIMHNDFVKLSREIANMLNDDLRKMIFKPGDFVPREQDYPQNRNIVNSQLAVLLAYAEIDIRDVVKPEDRHRWLTVGEWIDKVYNRVAPRGFPNTESPTTSSAARSTHANVIRESDGKLRPADGYRWVNPNDPKDFRVEPLLGVRRSEEPTNNPDKRTNAEELFTKGLALQRQKKYSEAIENYTAAIHIDPNDPRPYFNRGAAKLDLSDYRGAIADYNQFLQLCIATKADYERNPNKGNAVIEAKRAKQKEIEDEFIPLAYNSRGFAKEKLGNSPGACEDYRTSCILGNSPACENAKKVCN